MFDTFISALCMAASDNIVVKSLTFFSALRAGSGLERLVIGKTAALL
jgi:hypothetical protein